MEGIMYQRTPLRPSPPVRMYICTDGGWTFSSSSSPNRIKDKARFAEVVVEYLCFCLVYFCLTSLYQRWIGQLELGDGRRMWFMGTLFGKEDVTTEEWVKVEFPLLEQQDKSKSKVSSFLSKIYSIRYSSMPLNFRERKLSDDKKL